MSHNADKRKRRRARERAQKESGHTRLQNTGFVTAEDHAGDANPAQNTINTKEKDAMGMSKIKEQISVTNILLVFFTAILALVAVFQMLITRNQLNVMQNDERAWLQVRLPTDGENTIGTPNFQVVAGESVRVPLVITNIGKTISSNGAAKVNVELLKNSEPVHTECVDTGCPGVNIATLPGFFPNEKEEVPDATQYRATDAQVASYINGDVYIAVYGIITYDDVFGGHHRTKFCVWHGEPGHRYQAKKCTLYNDAD